MNWGKILGGVGGALAAPFTGGLSAVLGPMLGGIGSAAGGASQAKASNRGEEFEGLMGLEALLLARERMAAEADNDYYGQSLAREQEGRASGSDAWRKLLASQHVLSPGARPQLSPYSVAPRQATDLERQGATGMSSEVMARLLGGNQAPMPTRRTVPMDLHYANPDLLKAGKGESIMGWLAPILKGAGAIYSQPRKA